MIDRHDSIVVRGIVNYLTPFILIFGLYVFFHGHYSPGGGFQAGVLVGASIILKMLIAIPEEKKKFSITSELLLACLGVGIFLIVGAYALLTQAEFFNYEALSFLAEKPAMRRYYGILIAEIGITLVVSMTLVIIFHILALSPGNPEEEDV